MNLIRKDFDGVGIEKAFQRPDVSRNVTGISHGPGAGPTRRAHGRFPTTKLIQSGPRMRPLIRLLLTALVPLLLAGCSTVHSFFFEELDRQEMRISVDAAFFHGPNPPTASDQQEMLELCLGKRRPGNLDGFRISEAAIICASRGSLERSDELFSLAVQRSSDMDRRRIMLNQIIQWHRQGSGIRDQDLSPVLTDLSHTRALQLVEELQNRKQDYLVDRIYSFMIPRSSGVALADVLLQKGLYEYSMGRSSLAVAALQKTLELREDYEAHLILGRIYHEARDYDRASLHLEKAYASKKEPETAFLLARLEFSRKNSAVALDWIKKADEKNARVVELHGLILLSLDAGANPEPLLSSIGYSDSNPVCLQENRPFLENLELCSVSNVYRLLSPIRGRARIMRSWFGTTNPWNRKATVPYGKRQY